ncbi:hypothetical protein [Kitasatospora sp. RG8]|uniref:hypothetical protein n=1 Tax=Kitasatospora sp. RG8 TaxID=2820815 RepID=UPI0027DB23F5|nr:hypothetical protein [Kitasatospora sp. RG8]
MNAATASRIPAFAAVRPCGLFGEPLGAPEVVRPVGQQRGPQGFRRHQATASRAAAVPAVAGSEEGAAGGHGPVRYTVAAYVPGRWVRFAFTGPRGFDGFHECTVHRADGGRTVLRHTLAMHARGRALLSWPLLFRPLHDALIEDAMDRAERACTGAVARPARWSPLVRLLRRALRAGARRGAG